MVNLKKVNRQIRQTRYFTEEFRKAKVKEIEQNLTTVIEISRQYNVSKSAVYKWMYKYSFYLKKGIIQVIEPKSETLKTKRLKERVAELERIVGQKQLAIDFQDKLIEIASDEFGLDIKKKYSGKLSDGSGITKKNTHTR